MRHVAREHSINAPERKSCGELLRMAELKEVFLGEMGLEEKAYSKLGDYSLKINSHKHRKEKSASQEAVCGYLLAFYEVLSKYAQYNEIEISPFDCEYYEIIFNSVERENLQLREQIKNYGKIIQESNLSREKKQEYMSLVSFNELGDCSAEEENRQLLARLSKLEEMKDSLKRQLDGFDVRLSRVESAQGRVAQGRTTEAGHLDSARKYYLFEGKEQELSESKGYIKGVGMALLTFITLEVLLSAICLNFLGLLSLVQAWWAVHVFRMLSFAKGAEVRYNALDYGNKTVEEVYFDKSGLARKTGRKQARYVGIMLLCMLASIVQCVIFVNVQGGFLSVVMIAVEMAIVILSPMVYLGVCSLLNQYKTLRIEGADMYGRAFSLVYPQGGNKCYTLEEYERLLQEKEDTI